MSRPDDWISVGAPERFGGEEAFAVEDPAAGERRVHAGERPGGEASVDGRDGRVEDGARREEPVGFGHHERVDRRTDPREPRGTAREAFGAFGVAESHDELGEAVALLGGCADGHAIETERFDDFGVDRVVHRHSGDSSDHFADEEAIGDAVIAVARAGFVAR